MWNYSGNPKKNGEYLVAIKESNGYKYALCKWIDDISRLDSVSYKDQHIGGWYRCIDNYYDLVSIYAWMTIPKV